jgi:Ca-activated chloride channel family protein
MLRAQKLLPLFILSVVLVYAALPDSSAVAAQAPSTDDLILVPVMVRDSKDVPVTTLKQENFQLLEENKEQKIAYFSAAGEPVNVSVVLGLSAQGPVTSVGQRDRITVDITNAVQRVSEANAGGPATPIQSPLDSDGMFTVVTQAMTNLAKLPNPRKALIVVNDGLIASGSQASSIGPPKALLEGAKVSSFPIHFLFVINSPTEPTMTEGSRYTTGYFLEQAADFSGGAMHVGQIENNLTKVSTDLRDGLKNQYILGFKTANTAKDGKWRKLAVKIVNPPAGSKLKLQAKDRYFVPKG